MAVALESEGLVVSSAVKFRVRLRTRRTSHVEIQTHGYEVDLIGARANRLVLATVKSFFGSRGVVADHVIGTATNERFRKLYLILNHEEIRDRVVRSAAERFGYGEDQVELRLYVGRFAGPTQGHHERRIREWAASQIVGAGPIRVFGLNQVVDKVRAAAARTEYRDNPVLVTLKVLDAAGQLVPFQVGEGAERAEPVSPQTNGELS